MNETMEIDEVRRENRHIALGGLRDALVMMVDDDSMVIELTQAFLQDAGYRRFVSTSDSSGAVAMLLRELPDVVLVDLNMPHVSGFEIGRAHV